LSFCWPEIGKSYHEKHELFVIGRATNGSDGSTFEFEDLTSPNSRRAAIEKARTNAEQSALSWVASGGGYKSGTIGTRSAFWRTARGALEVFGSGATSEDWYHSIAWSNLAKVAPAISGNPSNWLGQIQSPGAWELALSEIEEVAPRIVLLITGGWMDAQRLRRIDAKLRSDSKFVRYSSNYDGRKWLIVERPEHQKHHAVIEEIRTAFGELN
jgi:hypothetical protein